MATKTKANPLSARMSFSQTPFSNNDKAGAPVTSSRVQLDPFTDTFSGSNNPSYRQDIKAVRDATTSASGRKFVVQPAFVACSRDFYSANPATYPPNQLGTIHTRCNMAGTAYLGSDANDLNVALPLTGAAVTRATNQAISKLYNQIKQIQTSVNAGEDLGEFGKTLKMLRSPLQSLIRLSHDVVNGHLNAFNYNKAKHIAKALADTTLEYNFGIRPIISTVAKGIVGLQNRDYIAQYFPINAVGKDNSVTIVTNADLTGPFACDTVSQRSQNAYVRYKGVWGLGSDFDRRSVQDVMGWNFRDTLTTVYNLIPYSWLVDYMTNLGDIVDSLSVPWDGMRWCVKTVRAEKSTTYSYVRLRTIAPYPNYDSFTPGKATISNTAFTRSRQTSLPVQSPQVTFNLSTGQQINVLALLASRVPIIGTRLNNAINKYPTLPNEYSVLTKRGSMYKIPYPFHRR